MLGSGSIKEAEAPCGEETDTPQVGSQACVHQSLSGELRTGDPGIDWGLGAQVRKSFCRQVSCEDTTGSIEGLVAFSLISAPSIRRFRKKSLGK